MTLPTYDQVMLPLLQFAGDGQEHHIREAINALADVFGLSDEERTEMMPNQKAPMFSYRTHWANTYLKKAGLLESAGRGKLRITQRGIDVLNSRPELINREILMQFPEFVEFATTSNKTEFSAVDAITTYDTNQTPEEIVYTVFQELRKNLIDELLEYVLESSPVFFERLVIDLLLAMGYGGALGTGQSIGQSGDGGIDGYIQEDKLGLDTIYVQAKRWAIGNVVGRPSVQAFVGSLMGAGASKGVFITTSLFSQQAIDYAYGLKNLKVILIDGTKLSQLMIEHNVGVSVYQTFVMKRVDRDYFNVE